MRFSTIFAAAAFTACASANIVSRQTGLPACAMQCVAQADLDGCQPTDNLCLCKSTKFLDTSTTCIGQQCKGADLATAIDVSKKLCELVGVTLTSTPAGFPTGTATEFPPSSTAVAPASTSSAAPASTSNAASINSARSMAGLAALGLAAFAW